MKTFLMLCLSLTLAACGGGGNSDNSLACTDDHVTSIQINNDCMQLLSTTPVNKPKVLWVFIHGDGSSGNASDGMFLQLNQLVSPGSMAIGMIRPGYYTLNGRYSTGPESDRRYDHYTQAAADYIADGLLSLKSHYQPERLIVVGYSGGAAMTALVTSFYPGLIDQSVLVACPCNVPEWRIHRRGTNNWPRSLSPHDYVSQIERFTSVLAIVGDQDENTYPQLTIDYADLGNAGGVGIRYEIIPNRDHSGIIDNPEPLIEILRTVEPAPVLMGPK